MMKTKSHTLLLTLGTALIALSPLPGQTLIDRFSADGDTVADGAWTSSAGSNAGTKLNLLGLPGKDPVVPGAGSFNKAFSFNGSGAVEAKEASTQYAGNQALYQDLTDLSVDIWFKADTSEQKCVLFTTGGQLRGFTLGYDNGTLFFFLKDGQAAGASAKIALSGSMGIDATADFVRATVTIDDTNNVVSLYSNGKQIATSTGKAFKGATGTHNTTIGGFLPNRLGGGDLDGGDSPLNDMATFARFKGDIASVEVYRGLLSFPPTE